MSASSVHGEAVMSHGKKNGVEHLRITQTIAFMALDAGTATPIPEDLRPRIEDYLAG